MKCSQSGDGGTLCPDGKLKEKDSSDEVEDELSHIGGQVWDGIDLCRVCEESVSHLTCRQGHVDLRGRRSCQMTSHVAKVVYSDP